MRVMTMQGGFRGLGALRGLGEITTAARNTAITRFLRRTATLEPTLDKLVDAREAGQLREGDEAALMPRYHRLFDLVTTHQEALDSVSSDAQLTTWKRRSEEIVREVTRWSRDVRRILGEEEANRGLRIALLGAASIAAVGGLSYLVWRTSR